MRRFQVRPLDILEAFWRDKWLVIGIVFFAGVASVVYALTREPVFTSEALLAPPEEEAALGGLTGILGQVSALTGIAGIPAFGGASVEEVVAVLKSRDFSLRFIRNHQLLPELFPDREWPILDPTERDQVTESPERQGGAALGLVNAAGLKRMTVEDVLERLDVVRNVTIDRRTNFVTLKVRARQPEKAQHIARALINDINSELRGRELSEAHRAEEFLREKIASTQFESIKNTAVALMEAQLKREVVAESRPDFALRVLDPPSLPEMRSYPRRSRMVMVGGLLGCIVATIFVLLRMKFLRSVGVR